MRTIDRIKAYIDFKGISLNAFDKSIGAGNGYIGKQIKLSSSIGSDVIEKIISIYTDLNPLWLITGYGEMITETPAITSKKESKSIGQTQKSGFENAQDVTKNVTFKSHLSQNKQFSGLVSDPHEHYGNIIDIRPNVYDLDSKAAAGMAHFLQDVDKRRTAPNLYYPHLGNGLHIQTDVKGDSMHPTLKDGDKAVSTHVPEFSDIRQGHIYLLIDKEEGMVYKRVYFHDKKHIELVSDNDTYKPYKVELAQILAFYKVREAHTTDLRNYWNEVRKDFRELRAEMSDLRAFVTSKLK